VWILTTSLLLVPFSIVGTWLAARTWGAMGALCAFLLVQGVLRIYSLHYQKSCFEVGYSRFIPMKLLGAYTALAATAGVVSYALRPLFPDPRIWFLVTGPLFAVLYLFGLYRISVWRLN